jgi:hypothetical protein
VARRSLHEDALLCAGLTLDAQLHRWGIADLIEQAQAMAGEPIAGHVASRALRKFRRLHWVESEPDPDTSAGPRYLYRFTESGRVEAVIAAGRELAAGRTYPLIAVHHLPLPPLGSG